MTENRRVCDGCRIRKVKCDFSYVNDNSAIDCRTNGCARCVKLKLSCTFDQPPKPRGRKRRQVRNDCEGNHQTTAQNQIQSLERNDTDSPVEAPRGHMVGTQLVYLHEAAVNSPLLVSPGYQPPTSHSLDAISQSPSNISPGCPLKHLCSRDLLTLIMDDYLRLIYPLVPLIHRPSFITDFHSARDVTDKDFHSLIIGLAAMVVSILPGRFRAYRAYRSRLTFQCPQDMLNHGYDIIVANRGPDYYDQINHCKWAVAYSMRIAFYHIGEHNRSRMMDVESMQIARLLYFHDISEYEGLNCIEAQLRKKAFWLVFYSYVHNQLQSLRKERLSYLDPDILEAINLEDLLPLEVDDESIFEDRWSPQPSGIPCIASGFVIHSRVFWAALRSTQTSSSTSHDEEACYSHRAKSPEKQIAHLKARLQELKYMLDSIPSRLRQWAPVDNESSWHGRSNEALVIETQFAVIRGNLHSTHIWIQSILLDQLNELLQNNESATGPSESPTSDQAAIWVDREELSRQLLHVLHSIPHYNLEPNGLNLTEKIRDVAVCLLSCPYPPTDKPAKRAAEYVRDFTEILARFELDPIHTSNTKSWIDTDRLTGSHRLADTPDTGHTTWS